MATRKPTDLIGFNPQYEGQSLDDYIQGRDTPEQATVQGTDYQGRLRRFDSPEALAANHAQGRASITFRRDAPGYATGAPSGRATPGGGIDFNTAYARHPATRGGVSPRDGNGLTQGQRRNILRAKGIGGSAQIALAHQMGQQADQQAQFNDLKLGELTARKQKHEFDMEQDLANQQQQAVEQWEQDMQNQSIGAQLAEGITQQYGETDDPYLLGAAQQYSAGNIEAGDLLMERRPAPKPGALEPVDIDNDGTPDFITQDGQFKGTVPRKGDAPTPTSKQRETDALHEALKAGEYSKAALLMGRVEEASGLNNVVRRPATVADARAYAQQLFDNDAEGGDYTPVQERGIESYMEASGKKRSEAIKALKEAGRL